MKVLEQCSLKLTYDEYTRCIDAIAAALQDEREATIEACAKVLDDRYIELSKRSYPPPTILSELATAIRSRKAKP